MTADPNPDMTALMRQEEAIRSWRMRMDRPITGINDVNDPLLDVKFEELVWLVKKYAIVDADQARLVKNAIYALLAERGIEW